MGVLCIEEAHELIEPFACTPVYCTGVAKAFVANGEVHLLWYIEQPGTEGAIERIANLRTIMRVEAFPAARAIVDDALKAARTRRGMNH